MGRVQNRSWQTRARVVGVVAALAIAVTACGDDDDDGASGDTAASSPATTAAATPTTAAPTETTAAGTAPATTEAAPETTTAGTTAGPATGEPIRAMVILDESDQMGLTYTTKRAAMDATVEDINANGGLGGSGRPVELEYCVTQFDPNLAQQCARDAADDESIVALVGNITNFSDQVNPILEEASMASVGTEPYSPGDGTSPNAFPIIAGYLSSVAGMGTVLADVAGATQISVMYVDTPSAQASVDTITRALEPRGLELVNAIPVPIGKADVSSETAAALEGSDGLALLTDPATANNVITAMTQQGNVVPVGGAGGQFSAEALAGLGASGDGLLLANWFASDDVDVPGVADFLRVMETYDTIDHSDDLAKSGYTAMLLLDEAVRGLDTIDRASILANLSEMNAFDTGGLTPVIDFTTPGPLEVDGTALPRFVNPTVMYGEVANSAVTAIDAEFVDPFAAP